MRRFSKAILSLFIILTVFTAPGYTAAKKHDATGKNISELFMSANPSLSAKIANSYAGLVLEAAKKFKQDPYAIAAIIVHESTVNNKAVSKGGDYGLMQIHWSAHSSTVKRRFKIKNGTGLFDPRINIFYGTEIFASCMAKSKSLREGFMRYSSGSERLTAKALATVQELRAKDGKAARTNAHAKPKEPERPKRRVKVKKR
ncbi:MAG: transglycosylase SLT domain-containing protein [Synergistaceae bacterium]|nr:transglycosylase SLT domain-containing protein [Synergistaceae bacterium]